MSRFGGDPRSYGGYDRGSGGPERWDPERFSRERDRAERSRGPMLAERDIYEERDIFQPRPARGSVRRESSADRSYHGGGGGRGQAFFGEKDIYRQEERFGPPARRPRPPPARYYDEEVDSFDGSPSRGQMVPFESRRKSISIEKNFTPPPRRAPPRPNIIRRQSSLDTFDRKPLPRYGVPTREPPETIVIPARSKRMISPPRFVERDYEEDIRVAEPDYYGDEDFRGYREREVSTVRRRRADSEVPEFKEEIFKEEVLEVKEEEPFPRRGKTKMPRRLVNKMAIIELGYPFEEEGETIIILKALGKEHIDEVIRISKEMNERPVVREEVKKTYVIESGPPPPPEPELVERRTEIIINPPPPANIPRSVREWDVMSGTAGGKSEHGGHKSEYGGHKSEYGGHKSEYGGHKSEYGGHKSEYGGHKSEHGGRKSEHGGHKAKSHRSHSHSRARSSSSSSGGSGPSAIEIVRKPSKKSRHRSRSSAAHKTEYLVEEKEESNSMHGLSLVVPSRSKDTHKDERQIKAEIRALEAEKKMLKYEREIEKEHRKADRYREEPVIIEREKDIVKIEKDRKAPNPKVVKAMLATLT